MGFYKILSTPLSALALNNYKGLYRSEPFPTNDSDKDFIELWERYIQYQEDCIINNIPRQFSLSDLKKLASQATTTSNELYEVVYINEQNICPYNAIHYGIDIAGIGGYSLIGDGLFNKGQNEQIILSIIGEYFRKSLNSYSLFNTEHEALIFKKTIEELTIILPNLIENETWKSVHIFGLT